MDIVAQGFPIQTETDGGGLWSNVAQKVAILGIELSYIDHECEYVAIEAKFAEAEWCVRDKGLIYTDHKWLDTFRAALQTQLNVPQAAAMAVDYSEQGMQGGNFVHLDCGKEFYRHIMSITQVETA